MSHRTPLAAASQESDLGTYTIIPRGLDGLDLDAYEYRVVCVLLSFRWYTGSEIIPRVSLIAAKARCTDRTVRRVVKRLELKGYLEVLERFRDDGGQTSNCYVLAGELAAVVSAVDALREQGGLTDEPPARRTAWTGHETNARRNYTNGSRSRNPGRPSAPETMFSGQYSRYVHR